MKRIGVLLAGLILVVATGTAMSDDGATLYKQCSKCHGEDGSKEAGGAMLKGQSAEEIIKKMHGYKDGTYGGAKKKIMSRMASRVNDDELKLIADHIAGF